MTRQLKALLPWLISLLVGLFLAEGAIRVASTYWFLNFDIEMWRYSRSIKRESTAPGIALEHAPNGHERLMGVTVRTDERGFRRPDPATEGARRPNSRVVVALGDSITMAWGAPEGQTFAAILERKLNERSGAPAIVLNAGVGNSNTSMELARYKRDVRSVHPDWIILAFFINDAEPDPVPTRNVVLEHSALAVLVYGAARVHGESAYRDYREYYRSLYRDGRPGWERCQQALRELGALLRQDGAKATLLLVPELHEPRDFGPFADIYRRVGDVGRQAGFEVIDPSVKFPSGRGERFFVTPGDAHPNGAAHALLAEALSESRYSVHGGK